MPIRPKLWGRDWHEHICVPLRLGEEVFECACPYAYVKDFEAEHSDCCDRCPYLSIIDSPNGRIRLTGEMFEKG